MSNATISEQSWQTLLTLFPHNWRELAEETSANHRLRGVPSLEALMRTLLLHLARGYSLHETVVRAKAAGVADLSAVALFKRLRQAEEWFNELCRALLPLRGLTVPANPEAVRLRLGDSTTVKEPGKTGSWWRIQYSFQLPEFGCDYFGLHPGEGVGTGDSFTQFPITHGDHVIGDRGYSYISGVEHIAAPGGVVLVRLNPVSLPLFTPAGQRFPLLRRIATLPTAGQVGEWPVVVQGDKRRVPGRFCAVRKSDDAITLAEKRLEQTASRKGREIRPETWEYVKYVMVFTTFSPRRFTTVEILQWYRVRWQVELVFKRLKSLAQLGHVPKSDAQSARAWLYGKLFVVLLTEQLMRHGRMLSPSAAPSRSTRAAQPVARVCVCLASAPASGRPRVIITVSDGELAHHCPSPLRMPTAATATDHTSPHSLKLTLMGAPTARIIVQPRHLLRLPPLQPLAYSIPIHLVDVGNLLQRVPPLTEQHSVRPHSRALGGSGFHQRTQLLALGGGEGLHKFRRRFHTRYYTAELMPTCLFSRREQR
jgi:Transposase DDE domain